MMFQTDPYYPLNVPEPLAPDIWVVNGDIVRMRYPVVGSLPFPTRMTVARLPDGSLWLHSPTTLQDDLATALDALGPVRWLVAPNRLHWVNLAAWQERYPDAETIAAPRLEDTARTQGFRIDQVLDDTAPPAWSETIAHVLVPGDFMTEAVFFHRPSATLIVTDLIENFERERVHGRLFAGLMRLGGVLHPHGGTPRDLRATFLRHRAEVRRAAETMLAWQPRRIVLAHGRLIDDDAPAALRRALHWTGAA